MKSGQRAYVYILTNAANRVLYTGVTSDLARRLVQHRAGSGSHFVARYKAYKLVYSEEYESMRGAIAREKQIKAGSRLRKIALIAAENPGWRDLSEDLF